MKKILLGLILLLISSMVFALNYNPQTQNVTIPIVKGWNIIPSMTQGFNSGTCDLAVSYSYDPFTKSYVQGFLSEDKYSDYFGLWTYFGSQWVYSKNNCDLTLSFYSSQNNFDKTKLSNNTHKLAKGWNFVTINPAMVGEKWADLYSNCDVTGTNFWIPYEQKWYGSSTTIANQLKTGGLEQEDALTNSTVGLSALIKVANDCYLSYGSEISGPPQLPA